MTDQYSDPKNLSSDPPDTSFNIRCPRLGHQINFKYCRSENSGIPCFKTLDCWYSHFNVLDHLKTNLTKKEFESAFIQKGKPKVFSLVDLINQAKERQTKKDQKDKSQAEKPQESID